MLKIDKILHEVEGLSTTEKWQLVRIVLGSLEQEQETAEDELSASEPAADWHRFLHETYGSLRDTPIARWDQGEYEERERLE